MIRVLVAYAVPVPVGHRVVVRWFRLRKTSLGFFGPSEDTFETRPQLPMIEDLETGIVHCTEWLLDTPGSRTYGEYTPVSEGPRAGMELERSVTGRVTACRIVTMRTGDYDVQTELTIDEAPDGYRKGG